MSEALWGVLIGGGIVTVSNVVVALIQANRESNLDQQKRRDDWQIESARFQRANLLELQEALNEWLRAVADMSFADQRGSRPGASSTSSQRGLLGSSSRPADA